MSEEYWEPWHPEIGQRVRIRLHGECQLKHLPNAMAPTHNLAHDKTTGTIVPFTPRDNVNEAALENSRQQGHRFAVLFATPIHGDIGGHFAAIELEPIEEPP